MEKEAKLGRHRQLKVPGGGGSALQLGVAQRIQVGDLAPSISRTCGHSSFALFRCWSQVSWTHCQWKNVRGRR